jgi:phenylacetate-coenzyme A ligase PaaK-like adenylate-forming protein
MITRKLNKQELIEWALEFPFYQWLYTEKGGVNNLDNITYQHAPILEKKFFFEYEEKHGEPYYTGIQESEGQFIETTSGTTGKPLKLVRDYKKVQVLFQCIGQVMRHYTTKKPVILTQAFPQGSMNIYLVQFPRRKEYNQVKDLLEIVNIPIPRALDLHDVISSIEQHNVNTILDPTGQWVHQLMKREVPLKEAGIDVILVGYCEPQVRTEILNQFLLLSGYFGTDCSGAFACPHYMEVPGAYHPFEELGEVYVLEDGTVKEYGEGLIVIDRYIHELFPFVKYTPEDIVRIEKVNCSCGRKKVFYMLGRAEREVRVPRELENPIRLDDVEKVVSPEGKYLLVYAKAKDGRGPYDEYRCLISFVEKDVQEPERSEELAQKVAKINSCEGIEYALPVVFVPEGTFTIIQMKERKLRTYFSVIDTFPENYLHLVDIARKVGIDIIVPSKKGASTPQ